MLFFLGWLFCSYIHSVAFYQRYITIKMDYTENHIVDSVNYNDIFLVYWITKRNANVATPVHAFVYCRPVFVFVFSHLTFPLVIYTI